MTKNFVVIEDLLAKRLIEILQKDIDRIDEVASSGFVTTQDGDLRDEMTSIISTIATILNPETRKELTSPLFWDCNCKTDYVHRKFPRALYGIDFFCTKCGVHQESADTPDSKLSEVINHLINQVI